MAGDIGTALTAARLRELLNYDPKSGRFRWIVTRRVLAGTIAGTLDSKGHRQIKVDGILHLAHRLAWLHHYGTFPSGSLDHANGIKDDNRIDNLRIATSSENTSNSRRRSDNTSGFKGVSFHKSARKWVAQIMKNGTQNHLGLFSTAHEAHAAYIVASKRLHGKFSRTS